MAWKRDTYFLQCTPHDVGSTSQKANVQVRVSENGSGTENI